MTPLEKLSNICIGQNSCNDKTVSFLFLNYYVTKTFSIRRAMQKWKNNFACTLRVDSYKLQVFCKRVRVWHYKYTSIWIYNVLYKCTVL